jgi:hypothetical protein
MAQEAINVEGHLRQRFIGHLAAGDDARRAEGGNFGHRLDRLHGLAALAEVIDHAQGGIVDGRQQMGQCAGLEGRRGGAALPAPMFALGGDQTATNPGFEGIAHQSVFLDFVIRRAQQLPNVLGIAQQANAQGGESDRHQIVCACFVGNEGDRVETPQYGAERIAAKLEVAKGGWIVDVGGLGGGVVRLQRCVAHDIE